VSRHSSQEVCPWNSGKFVQITGIADFHGRERDRERRRLRERELPGTTLPSLVSLMRMTFEEWDEWTRGSAIRRAGYTGLKRNVAVALGNWGSEEAVPPLVEALSDAEPLVRVHAAWALGEIPSPSVPAALADRLAVEDDAWVREAMELPLAGSSSTMTMLVGTTFAFDAHVYTADGFPVEGTVQWASTSPAILSVAADGTATAVSPGSAHVVATFDGHAAMMQVTVADPGLSGYYDGLTTLGASGSLVTELGLESTLLNALFRFGWRFPLSSRRR
jgi:hypothetical protein